MKLAKLPIRLGLAAVLLSTLNLQLSTAFAQGTAFTYQGVLSQNGAAINGSNDLTFTLYNAVSAGATVGTSNVVNDLVMTNGLFTVTLDFGVGAFDGTGRWLQIAARPGASTGAYTNLAPRTSITPTPYAIFAGGASAAGLSGTLPSSALAGNYSGAVTLTNAGNVLGGNGGRLTNLNSTNFVGTIADARLSANVALRAGGNAFSGNQIITGGNVGIGTNSPSEKLHVEGNILASAVTATAAGYGFDHTDGTRQMGTYLDGDGCWFGSISADPLLLYVNNNAAPSMTVATSGKVGIGTTTPGNLLDVAADEVIGNSTVVGINIHDTLNRGTKVSFGYNVPGSEFLGMKAVVNPGTAGCGNSGDLLFYAWECNTSPSREVMRIDGRGSMGLNGNADPGIRLSANSAATELALGVASVSGHYSSSAAVNDVVIRNSSAKLHLQSGVGAAAMTIDTTNNVGIGTTSPTSKLEVAGTVAASGLRAPGAGINTGTFAFTHRATAGSIVGIQTIIVNPLCDGDPDAILIVTHNHDKDTSANPAHPQVVGVSYTGANWIIFHEDFATPMEVGDAFNVMVIKP